MLHIKQTTVQFIQAKGIKEGNWKLEYAVIKSKEQVKSIFSFHKIMVLFSGRKSGKLLLTVRQG